MFIRALKLEWLWVQAFFTMTSCHSPELQTEKWILTSTYLRNMKVIPVYLSEEEVWNNSPLWSEPLLFDLQLDLKFSNAKRVCFYQLKLQVKCFAQSFICHFPVTQPCVWNAVSQPVFPTDPANLWALKGVMELWAGLKGSRWWWMSGWQLQAAVFWVSPIKQCSKYQPVLHLITDLL